MSEKGPVEEGGDGIGCIKFKEARLRALDDLVDKENVLNVASTRKE